MRDFALIGAVQPGWSVAASPFRMVAPRCSVAAPTRFIVRVLVQSTIDPLHVALWVGGRLLERRRRLTQKLPEVVKAPRALSMGDNAVGNTWGRRSRSAVGNTCCAIGRSVHSIYIYIVQIYLYTTHT